LLMLIFTVVGVSVIVYYAGIYGDRNGIPKVLRRIIVVIVILVFMRLVALVGILDLVFNLRKLKPEKDNGGIK